MHEPAAPGGQALGLISSHGISPTTGSPYPSTKVPMVLGTTSFWYKHGFLEPTCACIPFLFAQEFFPIQIFYS